MDIMDTRRNSLSRWAPVLLRLIVGYGFMAHGYAKLVRGPHVFAAILQALGVPSPDFMAWATILVEVVWRLGSTSWSFPDDCKCANGHDSGRRHVHCASALWLQFHQARDGDFRWCTVRTAGL